MPGRIAPWHEHCFYGLRPPLVAPNPDVIADRKETIMDHKQDKRISALHIAQLIAELVAYELELAAREAAQ